MPRTIPIELRSRVTKAYNLGEGSYDELSRRFKVCLKSVYRWVNLERRNGDASPKPHAGGRTLRIPNEDLPLLLAIVAEKPDRTVTELAEEWRKRTGVDVPRATVGRALLRAGLPFKKNLSSRRAGSRRYKSQGSGVFAGNFASSSGKLSFFG